MVDFPSVKTFKTLERNHIRVCLTSKKLNLFEFEGMVAGIVSLKGFRTQVTKMLALFQHSRLRLVESSCVLATRAS